MEHGYASCELKLTAEEEMLIESIHIAGDRKALVAMLGRITRACLAEKRITGSAELIKEVSLLVSQPMGTA
jgi:hypothetical protein